MLIPTSGDYLYSRVDERVFSHSGVIVDIGCLAWDWGSALRGKKRYIGVDPNENPIEGAELFKGVISSNVGLAEIDGEGNEASLLNGPGIKQVPCITWRHLCKIYNINSVSVAKFNCEMSEYPILFSMNSEDFSMIDQIAVSFHDWMNPALTNNTKAAIYLLELEGFQVQKLDDKWGWWLAVKR